MDIKHISSNTSSELRTERTDKSAAAGEGKAANSAGATRQNTGDQLTLTDSAQRLLDAARTAQDAPAVDRARVDAIRASIADGSYVIDPERIAAGLLRAEQDLGD